MRLFSAAPRHRPTVIDCFFVGAIHESPVLCAICDCFRDVEDVVPYQRVFIFPVGAIHKSPVLHTVCVCFRDVEDVVPYQRVFIFPVGAIQESPVLKTTFVGGDVLDAPPLFTIIVCFRRHQGTALPVDFCTRSFFAFFGPSGTPVPTRNFIILRRGDSRTARFFAICVCFRDVEDVVPYKGSKASRDVRFL